MDLILGRSPWVLLLLLVVAAAFAWWAYSRSSPLQAPPRRVLLAGLRFAVLGLILFLLFEPILQRIFQQDEAPVVAWILDDTRGLSSEEDRPGEAQVRQIVAQHGVDGAEMIYYRFDAETQRIEDADAELSFQGARTDISRALETVADDLSERNLRAVVLVSDGRYNTGRNPLYLADRYPVAIHTITVGDTTRPQDVWIGEVITNEIAYTGVELPVRAHIHAEGFADRQATVTLSLGGATLDQQVITLPQDGRRLTVDLATVPEEEGVNRYAVSVSQLEGEATHANNTAFATTRVESRQRTALLLSGAPGPDLAAIRQALTIDPDLEVISRTTNVDGTYYEGSLTTGLDDADLIVLVGFPGPRTAPLDVAAVVRAADGGTPILFVLSPQTDLQQVTGDLADLLPAHPEAVRTTFLDAQIEPTSAAAGHAVTRIPGLSLDEVAALPPIQVSQSRWISSPDSRVLVTPLVRGIRLEDPLISVRERDRLRSAAILAAGTWRWSNLPADLAHLDGFFPGLIENLTRWLTAGLDDRLLRVQPTREFFDSTERIRFTAQAYDESLAPAGDAEVQVTIVAEDGNEWPFSMRPLGSGRFDLDAGALPEGSYRFQATADRHGAPLGDDAGSFQVGTLDLELRDVTADAALMAELSARTGGVAAFADQAQRLEAAIEPQLQSRAVATTEGRELWRMAPLALLLVGMLTAEWVLRKRSGMV